jgi:hypothetical protein
VTTLRQAGAEPVVDGPPGMHPARLLQLMGRVIEEMRLDLTGSVVLTEAATGPYVVTPVLAAMAGAAEVVAVTRASRFGSVADVIEQTVSLAAAADVEGRITVTDEPVAAHAGRADIVTNSGHVRPIDEHLVQLLRPSAVVPLMFETWEIQAGRFDVDLPALQRRGIAWAGTNERHPTVDVFSHLGTMAIRLLTDARYAVHGARVVVLCDNPFAPYLVEGLSGVGASPYIAASLDDVPEAFDPDVVLVALRPRDGSVLSTTDAARVRHQWPETLVAQFWGDLDRDELRRLGLRYWPVTAPVSGHMAVLPSDIGPEPVVRLQAGGLKVGSVLRQPPEQRSAFDRSYLDEL